MFFSVGYERVRIFMKRHRKIFLLTVEFTKTVHLLKKYSSESNFQLNILMSNQAELCTTNDFKHFVQNIFEMCHIDREII